MSDSSINAGGSWRVKTFLLQVYNVVICRINDVQPSVAPTPPPSRPPTLTTSPDPTQPRDRGPYLCTSATGAVAVPPAGSGNTKVARRERPFPACTRPPRRDTGALRKYE
ncbi:hypothetical protein OE88DRAFT_1649460 [Heliocybe sulcata]|uniref:Uncharacterized protein n=1 Tax=Heliocybe sulcata TaxID=5364 RepID=A0A5C3MII0_9AGAM|nr:hypothetical protein OE88DRAFT_1649460 [Heliocybe sulcata]